MEEGINFDQPYPIAISVVLGVSTITVVVCIWIYHCFVGVGKRGKRRGQWPRSSSGGLSSPSDLEMGNVEGGDDEMAREALWRRDVPVKGADRKRTQSFRSKGASSTWGRGAQVQGVASARSRTPPNRRPSLESNPSVYRTPLGQNWSKKDSSDLGHLADVSDWSDSREGKVAQDGHRSGREPTPVGRFINPPVGFIKNLGTVRSVGGRPVRKVRKARRDSSEKDG